MRLRPSRLMTSAAFGAVAVTALAGCGSSTPNANPSTSPSTSPATSASPTATATTPFQRVTPTPTPTAAPTGATDLHITSQVRSDLVAAGAKARGLNPSDFTGLAPGYTYYAFDAATNTYWAGGALVPSSSSYQARVSSQDDGGYTLFHRSAGAWIAIDGGMAGPNSGTGAGPCRVVPPADVLAMWGWPANSCHPTGV